jgi:hypothetical protein
MPYRSKSEQASAQWMPVNSALEHIQKFEGSFAEAKRQLFNAIADGELPFRWADSAIPRIPWGAASPLSFVPWSSTIPDRPSSSWNDAQFRPDNGGEVFCDEGLTDEGKDRGLARFRPLTVLRARVRELWPGPPPSRVTEIVPRDLGGRPSSRDDVFKILDRPP